MNRYWKFMVDSAVEKRVSMWEHVYSFSKNHSVDYLLMVIEESKRVDPYQTKKNRLIKGGPSVFLLDDVVVKKDDRPYMRRLTRPKIINDPVVGQRGLLMEGICTLIANKIGYPSCALLGIKYLPLEKHSVLVYEKILCHTFRHFMLEKESEEKVISEMMIILHQCLLKGIFHGDLNPNNILFDMKDRTWKLIDFYQSVKLNTDIGMGLALQMGGVVSLPFAQNISLETYIEAVLDYLHTHFGNQPQHSSTFLHFINIRFNNTRRLGRPNRRIMYNMATLGKPDILGVLPLAYAR